MNKRIFFVFTILILLLPCCSLLNLLWGSTSLSFSDIFQVLTFSKTSPKSVEIILWKLRLPRLILGLLVGSSLAVSGGVMQGVFRNPLADPFLLGIAGGATAGAALCISLGFSGFPFLMSISAFLGGALAVSLVYILADTKMGRLSNLTLILSGIAIGSMFSALTTFLTFLSSQEQMKQIIFWTMGDLGTILWIQLIPLTIIVIPSTLFMFFYARSLNVMVLGDSMAYHLGVKPKKTKKILLVLTTLLTGAVVSVSGTIGFVGLIIPHTMRMLLGPDHRFLLPGCCLAGASFLLFCDTMARTLLRPIELPVGLMTSLLGAPFFLYLLYQHIHSQPSR